jgi:hypothetical protein
MILSSNPGSSKARVSAGIVGTVNPDFEIRLPAAGRSLTLAAVCVGESSATLYRTQEISFRDT